MQCSEYQVWVSCEMDGELDAERTRALHRHLASCDDCRRVQEDFRLNRLLLHAMTPVSAPEDGWQRLSQRMAEAGDASPRVPMSFARARARRRSRLSMLTWGPRTRRAFEMAAGFVVVFVSLLLWLGYTDADVPAVVVPAPAPVQVHASTLLRGHAILQAANPMGDRSAWHYLASDAGETEPADAASARWDAAPVRYGSEGGTAY